MIKYSYDVFYNNEFVETRIVEFSSAQDMEEFRNRGKYFSITNYELP